MGHTTSGHAALGPQAAALRVISARQPPAALRMLAVATATAALRASLAPPAESREASHGTDRP